MIELDLVWVLFAMPLAFALGWFASHWDFRQQRFENRHAPKPYFKGLNFLLNEQQDKAIDAFIEAVQIDPDTSELHFALGNLFRRRGEYDRAVRAHEHLLSRADLSQVDRDRAQHALSLDYIKAGLLDRAEAALRKLEGTAYEKQAWLALLAIYERSQEWPQASGIANKLEASGHDSFVARKAHYLCEQAAVALKSKQSQQAETLLCQAIVQAPQLARPRMDMAALQTQQGHKVAALQSLQDVVTHAPASTNLIVKNMATLAIACGQTVPVLAQLKALYGQAASLDLLQAIVSLETAQNNDLASDWYVQHIERQNSLVAAARWIEGEKLEHEQFHPQVQRALERAVKPLLSYRCAACGFDSQQHFWHCPGCQSWDSFSSKRVEEL